VISRCVVLYIYTKSKKQQATVTSRAHACKCVRLCYVYWYVMTHCCSVYLISYIHTTARAQTVGCVCDCAWSFAKLRHTTSLQLLHACRHCCCNVIVNGVGCRCSCCVAPHSCCCSHKSKESVCTKCLQFCRNSTVPECAMMMLLLQCHS
jgi:hypothetical protein